MLIMANQTNPQRINRNLRNFAKTDAPCSYVPGKRVQMNHREVDIVSTNFSTRVTQRGWRRFGRSFIYPVCKDCNACKSLRIDVANYKFSKSQQKIINRNERTEIVAKMPQVTDEHIALYNKYHQYKSKHNGWKHTDITRTEYFENYVEGAHEFGKELRYYIDGKLVCVDLIDILDDSISAIYCYYDPDYPRFSLGTYSLLYEIQIAESLGLDWVYLGYWVEGYKSFEYKKNFQPLQILDGFPLMFETADWKPWTVEN
ncbi:MAG: Arginine-tRNA-protein transferase (EC [uncultured Sulfurovum sp.]|uniref:Aspartate/glutamate leucyltransferase n=1 Tax=uncultured Sulfurovum sp. TaxID=269237 RepID=A0A6S6U6Y3_9BACT|nr:MAG: Arginine-tRNA-protein transferase (EC [uncultured Sulfurovum sp.]